MNRILQTILVCVALTSTQVRASQLPDWLSSTPVDTTVYCVELGPNIDDTRKIAVQFASEDRGASLSAVEVSGQERAHEKLQNGNVVSSYEMKVETVATGEKQSVFLIDEVILDDSLCVLVG